MRENGNNFLVLGAIFCGIVAAVHIGCAIFGGDWYRVLGAGEQLTEMSEQGHWYPPVITLVIASIFIVWSLYALSGARKILRLPFLRTVLCIISAILIFRALAFFIIMPLFPGNSLAFWIVSSAICFGIGALYTIGLVRAWPQLGAKSA
ncbi:hypothetical protein HXX02_07945 [Microbulbifer elongatus]|uniref:DUF3995 domain-containing protein n=2 Tax=Microbulbifer elongatus TaxID=86173 RepID=A0ABT1NZS8_9GAMM|nr:hypothetical protein [Microbulbifer elongatus]MCQ3829375.1 hypothetical protein [Microbulbifer elongatus]